NLLLDEIQRPEGGRGLLVDLDDVTLKVATLGDHQRIGLDVAAYTAGRRNLHVASSGHVAVVVTQNDGVHRLHGRVDDTLLANDPRAAHPEPHARIATGPARTLARNPAFGLGGNARGRERGAWAGARASGLAGLVGQWRAASHLMLVPRSQAPALGREIREPEAGTSDV